MRITLKVLVASFIAAAFPGLAGAATDLFVTVKSTAGAGIPGVEVVAVNYGMNGPSTYTVFGQTDSSGYYTLQLLDNTNYNLYVNKHGYSPSIRDQFNNPDPSVQRYFWTNGTPVSSTITLTQDQVEVGRIQLPFINATADKVLFGGVNINGLQEPGFFGMVKVNSFSSGTLTVDNVPYAEANTYNIGIYDPEKNRGIGRNVTVALDAGTPLIAFAPADFDQSVPPRRTENTVTQDPGASSNSGVEGVIQNVNFSTMTVANMGLSFRYCDPGMGTSSLWAHADENGYFQLSGLIPGVTYYAEVMGGCSWRPNEDPVCYAPYRTPGLTTDLCIASPPPPAPGLNDFVYVSTSDSQYVQIKLAPMPKSIGQIKVYVKGSDGSPMPNSNVNIHPDGSPWSINSCSGLQNWNTVASNPGFSNANMNTSATGYALLDGLPSGNYMIQVWTPFSSNGDKGPTPFNAGSSTGTFDWSWERAHCGGGDTNDTDDLRVAVDTDPVTNGGQYLHVYDRLGTDLGLSSITYVVQTVENNTGEVKGALKFPAVTDLSERPITISLFPNCREGEPCPPGNFKTIVSSGASQYSYSLHVASGISYHMNVKAAGWGRVNRGGGNNIVDLASTGTVTVNMEFAPAGTINGTLYKPDGTVYTPGNNQYIWVDAGSDTSWTGTQLQKDGTFSMEDVLPGVNRLSLHPSGHGGQTFNYALPEPPPTVIVTANGTSTVNLNLVAANYVGVAISTAMMPDNTILASRYNQILGFKVIPLPAGTIFKGETISEMLAGKDDESEIRYSTGTAMGEEGVCGQGWPGGFCAIPMPSPSIYDFYLMRSGDFGDMSSSAPVAGRPYPHFTMITSTKNVIIDSAHAQSQVFTAGGGVTPSSGVLVNMNPAASMANRGNAVLYGEVTANNFFRQVDYDALNGDFDKFIRYLPVVSLYDANGKFSAAGIVVPPPDFIAQHDQEFNQSFSQGYDAFKNLLIGSSTFGYEIRSLAPSSCYTAVVTTPNYPPYQRKVCLGVNGSTTTLSFDLDAVAGTGATLSGVVKTTAAAGVPIAGANVEIVGEGIDPRSAVTDSSGSYKFEGLPEGTVRIKVSVSGYASGEAEKDLNAAAAFTQDFGLMAAAGSISGTVYSQKMPFAKVQPGALIYAYNDTYNGMNPASPLPLIKTKTGSDGVYTLTGLIAGDTYKIFLKVPGRYTLNLSTPATAGLITGMDFTMLTKPLDIEIFGKLGEDTYDFTVLNPQDFKTGNATWSAAPYNAVGASTVTLNKLSSGQLSGSIPLASLTAGVTYVLRGVAVSLSNKTVVKEILFGRDFKGNSEQAIDDVILGDDSDDGTGRRNNEASMDQSGGDPSALVVPAGAMLPISTGAIPTCSFKGEDKDSSAVSDKVNALGADAFAGDLYTISLSSVSLNPDKGFEITLAYDKNNSSLTDLGVGRYNETSGQWETVPGLATVNPLKGTVKVKLKSLASVLAIKKGYGPAFSKFNGKEYVPAAVGSTISGMFAVVKPSIAGNALGKSKVKVFNFPNPFNLKDKAGATYHGASVPNTVGTTIHVEVPAGNGGAGHVRIYTLAGELVRDIAVDFTADAYNYVNWDGKNKSGQEVANGVYYGIVELSGSKPDKKDATFKMAVIK